MFWNRRKKSCQSNNFWVSYGPSKYVHKWSKMSFSGITPKYWHLNTRKEQNLFRSEFYMCVPSLVKIDWEMPAKNPRLPPGNWVFWHFNIRARWFPAHHRDRLVTLQIFMGIGVSLDWLSGRGLARSASFVVRFMCLVIKPTHGQVLFQSTLWFMFCHTASFSHLSSKHWQKLRARWNTFSPRVVRLAETGLNMISYQFIQALIRADWHQMGQIGNFFKISFQYSLAWRNMILKSPWFVSFDDNLTHYRT